MIKRIKAYWAELQRGRPGSRFHEQYERNQKKQKSPVGRALRISAGVLSILAGIFFLAVPGPGLLIIGLGAVLIARESGFAARFLDAMELRGRNLWKWARRRWRQLTKAGRAVTR